MTIRIRETDDVELVKALNQEIFKSAVPIDSDDLDDAVWWVAYHGTEPAAFAGIRPDGFMARAGVLPAYRGGGLQQRLIRKRVAWARAHGLVYAWTYVAAANVVSMRSLNKCGFLPYRWERVANTEGTLTTFVYLSKRLQKASEAA